MPISLRVSWRVMEPSTTVETSPKSSGRIHFDVLGPAGPRELVPLAVGMSIYTDGDVLFDILISVYVVELADVCNSCLQGIVQRLVEIRRRIRIGPVCGPEVKINCSNRPIGELLVKESCNYAKIENRTYMLHVDGHGSSEVSTIVVVVYVVTVAGTVAVAVSVFVMVAESVSVTDTVHLSVVVVDSVSTMVVVLLTITSTWWVTDVVVASTTVVVSIIVTLLEQKGSWTVE